MYGSGKPAPTPAPPVPWVSASNATQVPSAATPALIFEVDDGRLPPARCSSFRSSISFTGAPAIFASFAQATPCASGPNLLPKPPPMYSQIVCTFACGICSASAKPSRLPCTACVEIHAVSLSPSHSHTQPFVSRHTCVCTCVSYVASTMCAADLKPASRSPLSSASPCLMLPPSKTAGAPGCRARASIPTCGSTSYCTLIKVQYEVLPHVGIE